MNLRHDSPAQLFHETRESLCSLLQESAELSLQWSQEYCVPSTSADHGCQWFHGPWQYLRILGLVASPDSHGQFYLDAFRRALPEQSRDYHCLIAGAGDYSLPHYLLCAAASRNPLDPTLTIADRCPTPLQLCEWYGKKMGVPLRTIILDLRDPVPTGEYDLIATDSLLTRFNEVEARHVASRLSGLLGAQGKLITAVRVHRQRRSGVAPSLVGPFMELTDMRIKSAKLPLPPNFRALAREYAAQRVSYVLGTADGVVRLLDEEGLVAISRELASVEDLDAPTDYLRLVLRRRCAYE